MAIKVLRGIVCSLAGAKTVAVQVSRTVQHPRYRKFINLSKKFLAEDPDSACLVGDTVEIISVKPISRRKRWSVIRRGAI